MSHWHLPWNLIFQKFRNISFKALFKDSHLWPVIINIFLLKAEVLICYLKQCLPHRHIESLSPPFTLLIRYILHVNEVTRSTLFFISNSFGLGSQHKPSGFCHLLDLYEMFRSCFGLFSCPCSRSMA